MTTQIDKDIVKVSEQMPPSFWQPPALDGIEKDSPVALRESKRAFDHMCYYILIIELHLPHMLCPTHASQRMYSKIACVNASREILLREIALRSLNPISACCRMSDFLALIAGMIPVAIGSGEGADFRAPLGRAVIGGTITSTLLTLLVIPTVYEILDEMRSYASSPCFDALLDELANGPPQEGAPKGSLRHPLVIGWGRQDRVCLPQQAARAEAAFPDARLHWFERCGHFPHWDQPAATARLILDSTG